MEKIDREPGDSCICQNHDANAQKCQNHECSEDEACGCGHSHEEKLCMRDYLYISAAGVFLAAALAGEHIYHIDLMAASVFALLSCAFTGIPIIYNALKGLFGGRRNVCELAGLAIAAAVLSGEYIAAAEVGFILTIGEIAEDYAYKKTGRDIDKIASANPKYGFVKKDGVFAEVLAATIMPGDIVLVRPGDVFPCDGLIISGKTSVDESFLTGESIPAEKGEGDPVYSGSVNKNGSVEIKVTKKGDDSTYSNIVKLIREAEKRKPPSYPFIEKFAAYYTPLTLAVTAFAFIVTGSVERAITILIVACPCALLLSTPSAVIAGIGAGARRGVLLKSGAILEETAKCSVVMFDKTGTLTKGDMDVSEVLPLNNYSGDFLVKTAASAESGMEHPIAKAIVRFAGERGINSISGDFARRSDGIGIIAESESETIIAGDIRYFEKSGVEVSDYAASCAEKTASRGMIPVLIGRNGELIGILGLEDSVREESPDVVQGLLKMGIKKIFVLTGDRKEVALSVSQKCGISPENVCFGITPGDKREIAESFQEDGESVLFIGDGINDGPALAQANVGVSVGARENNIAIETSDAVILKDNLRVLLLLVKLGKVTVRTIKINVVFALSFTFMLVLLSILGIVNPVTGAIGHQAATLGVLINSAFLSVGLNYSK